MAQMSALPRHVLTHSWFLSLCHAGRRTILWLMSSLYFQKYCKFAEHNIEYNMESRNTVKSVELLMAMRLIYVFGEHVGRQSPSWIKLNWGRDGDVSRGSLAFANTFTLLFGSRTPFFPYLFTAPSRLSLFPSVRREVNFRKVNCACASLCKTHSEERRAEIMRSYENLFCNWQFTHSAMESARSRCVNLWSHRRLTNLHYYSLCRNR